MATFSWLALSLKDTRLRFLLGGSYIALLFLSMSSLNNIALPALVSAPIIAGTLIVGRFSSASEKRHSSIVYFSRTLYLTYLAIITIYLGLVSLVLFLGSYQPIDLDHGFFLNHLYQIYLVLSWFSPVLLILLALFIPLKLISSRIILIFENWKRKRFNTMLLGGQAPVHSGHTEQEIKPETATVWNHYKVTIYLIIIMAILTMISLFSNGMSGVDTNFYIRYIEPAT